MENFGQAPKTFVKPHLKKQFVTHLKSAKNTFRDFEINVTLKGAASAVLDPQGASLLTLIQEQLGMKLVSAKDPVEVLVVDHAEGPSPN